MDAEMILVRDNVLVHTGLVGPGAAVISRELLDIDRHAYCQAISQTVV